jgi:hypothetical protein
MADNTTLLNFSTPPVDKNDILEAVVKAAVDAVAAHGCSLDVHAWNWDLSNVPYPGERAPARLGELSGASIAKIAAFSVMSLVGVVGNTAVVVRFASGRSLKNSMNYYLVNLAIADIVVATFCAWTYLVDDVTKSPWILGPVVCKIGGFVQSSFT